MSVMPRESGRDLFKGRQFDREVIVLWVRGYLSFKLSSRDLVQMMSERGIALAHKTILRWVQRYDFQEPSGWPPHDAKQLGTQAFGRFMLGTFLRRVKVYS
jgi:transposase-like protein